MEEEIEGLVIKLRGDRFNFKLQRQLLSLLRSSKIRKSGLVNEFGTEILKQRSKLGDEGWKFKHTPPFIF